MAETAGGIGGNMFRRDQFIPVRKSEIIAALKADPVLASQAGAVARFCQLIGSIFHFENYAVLEKLREDYFPLNPELEPPSRMSQAELQNRRAELDRSLVEVLTKANYSEIEHTEVEDAHNERRLLRVKVRAPLDDYNVVKFYQRGRHQEEVEVRRWFGLSRKHVMATVFDSVVLVVGVKSLDEIANKRQRKRLEASSFKPGSTLIKYFRNITVGDLYMLLPQVRVVMSLTDQLTIGVPAIAGAVPLALNLLPALTVLSLVAGYYLGLAPDVDNETMVKSFGALTGIAAIIGFIFTQRMKYQRRSLQYQKEISDHFYFRNVSNNSGIFDSLVGSAEDQEFKEAVLAYCFLLAAGEPLTEEEIDRGIEAWLLAKYQLDLDFEVTDALAKLERLTLLQRQGDRYTVPPPAEALVRLDRIWDNLFPYANEAEPAGTGG